MRKTKPVFFSGIIIGVFIALSILIVVQKIFFNELHANQKVNVNFVDVESFGANGTDLNDDSLAIQKAIDYSAKSKIGKVKLQGNKNYILTRGIKIKEGVTLEFDQNTRLYIEGNFRGIEVEKNASIYNGIIEVSSPEFDDEVIYLNGSEQFWSSTRTNISNVTIVNSSERNKGTGIKLVSEKSGDFISFTNFQDIEIIGFYNGVRLISTQQGSKAEGGYSYINGNRFINLTLDDCVSCIEIVSSATVPNEVSGNEFSGLQIQISKATKKILTVSGSNNRFEAMVWDTQLLEKQSPIIVFTDQSAYSLLTSNLQENFISDRGNSNKYLSN
ncbi:glycoside hydrolase family 55 protein [Metabacillus idriensis]|uniref:Pectate lyase superfamily protein domain-containing protein n=1 Tax=Metabacillus idriensis TaxID=324768 RepID=A0A6I2MDG6_9BACI|nr:hypothetical protein [Metabacillus idriensis]MCM3598322.1 glycoside hydrolase family 55 protein [Metabacillus idriensis]MRX55056.1 hypothetical protein [Metabacillus idriensis]OHR71597.1 hypothetical protein HMPREF3291_23905 [Bacillus sp. HMSC76G11]